MNVQPSAQIPFAVLPEGTVTFLFTDIEGSTQLLGSLRERYAELLADHHRLLRESFVRWHGHEVDTQGDSFFVAFSRATQAVSAAVEAQRKLHNHAWPQGVTVRLRMGIHTGEPWSGEEGYVGMDVHRASRIANTGHGGQVLLSETTIALVQDELPQGVSTLDLGRHLLKDLNRPEHICQLVIEGLPSEFPPLNSLEALPAASARLPRQVGACPYRGLAAFQEPDAPFYFGREAFVDCLEQAIRTRQLVAVIVGSSGSGKSSALFAGLLPRLRKRGGFQFASFRPGTQPYYALAGALLPLLEPGLSEIDRLAETRNLAERFLKKQVSLTQVVERIQQKQHLEAKLLPDLSWRTDQGVSLLSPTRLLLVADQFEELYTLCPDEEQQKAFIDQLLAAVEEARTRKDGSAVILLTLRADFMGQALAHRPFADALQEASLLMGPMNRQELHMAIEKPAEMQGAAFEPGLVERILDDVGEKPGNLPLLEFTLTQLWETQTDGWLAHSDYEGMGCVEGALACYADQVFADLEEGEQELAHRALVQLVQPGEGTEDTRRIATKEELGEGSWGLIQRLADRRLVVTGRDAQGRETAEVVHEALIQKWGRFREWMSADRAFRSWQERLRGSLYQWQESGQDEGALLHGAPLAVAQGWLAERQGELSPAEVGYIELSQAQLVRRQKETERRRQRAVLALSAGLVVVALLAVLAFWFARQSQASAVVAQNEANTRATAEAQALAAKGEALELVDLRSRDAQVNQSLALAAQSSLALKADNLDLALALAMEANRIPDPPGQAQMALSEAAYAPGSIRVFTGHQDWVVGLAVSPDGRYGISGDNSGVIFLWDLESGEVLRRLEGHTAQVASLAFTPDGRQAVSGSLDHTIIHWDLETGKVIKHLDGHQSPVNTVAVSPDGHLLASGSGRWGAGEPYSAEDNSLRLWNLESGEEIRRFTSFNDAVTAVSFTPDGQRLAVGTTSDGFILLEIETGKFLIHRQDIRSLITAVKASTSDRVLATHDHFAVLMDLGSDEIVTLGKHATGPASGLDVSPDGLRGLSCASDSIIEWNLQTKQEIRRFNIGAVSCIYLPDGKRALVGSEDGTVRLLALTNGAEIGRLPVGNWATYGIAYDPGGRSAVTDDAFSLTRWDLKTGKALWTTGENIGFWDIAFTPDGKYIFASDYADSASLWDAASGEKIRTFESDGSFEGYDAQSMTDAVALHPGGKFGLVGAQYGTGQPEPLLIYWDLESGKPVWIAKTGSVLAVAISPDGRTALSAEAWPSAVKWWDLETGELKRSMEGHTGIVRGVGFVDDRTALSGSEDRTMILWDLESGAAVRSYLGHSEGVRRLSLSPDRRLVLSSSADGTVILWDVQAGEPLRRYAGHTDVARIIVWGPDGKEALSGGSDYQTIRWRIDADLGTLLDWVRDNRYVRQLTCNERLAFNIEPLCKQGIGIAAPEETSKELPETGLEIALLPPLTPPAPIVVPKIAAPTILEAGRAAWGANYGSIEASGGQAWEYAGTAGERLSLLVSADEPANLTWDAEQQNKNGLLDLTLVVYAPNGTLVAQADDLEGGISTDAYLDALTLPQDGIYRIEVRSYRDQSGGSYRLILAEPRPLVLRGRVPTAAGLAIHPTGRTALVGMGFDRLDFSNVAGDYRIWEWDLESGEVVRYLDGHTNTPVQIAIRPDGLQALSAGLDGNLILWDLQTGTEIRRFEKQAQAYTGVLFHPDGKTALTGSMDSTLARWDLESGDLLQRYEGHTTWVLRMALSPDGNTLYSTSGDNSLRVWDVATGATIATYQPFSDGCPNGLAISPDGKLLLVGKDYDWTLFDPYVRNTDSPIALLDASTGEKLVELSGHSWIVLGLAFSPDGRYALSGSGDQTVRLWDIQTGKQLAVFHGHAGEVINVAFSPDGLTGYSTGGDGTLRVWDLREYIGSD